MSKQKIAHKKTPTKQAAKAAQKPADPELVLSASPLHNGSYFIPGHARLADVLADMFSTDYDDEGGRTPETFLRAALTSVTDDLTLLQLAAKDESFEDDMRRVVERLRNRLVTAQWLFERMREAGADSEVPS